MNVFIVSDFHIWGAEDPFYRTFLVFIRERLQAGDLLVIAGDLFDLFVGSKAIFNDRYCEFLTELKAAAKRGVEIHYIEGNHDFLIERSLGGIPGIKVHGTDFRFTAGGKRFFVAHGDQADSSDYGYRFMRFMFRSWLMKLVVAVFPGRVLDCVGQWSSRVSSRQRTVEAHRPLESLRKVYRNFAVERIVEGFDYVVLGHVHDADEMTFVVEDRQGQYINVGYPREHKKILVWSPGQETIQRVEL